MRALRGNGLLKATESQKNMQESMAVEGESPVFEGGRK